MHSLIGTSWKIVKILCNIGNYEMEEDLVGILTDRFVQLWGLMIYLGLSGWETGNKLCLWMRINPCRGSAWRLKGFCKFIISQTFNKIIKF